jgi:hypothetical protein
MAETRTDVIKRKAIFMLLALMAAIIVVFALEAMSSGGGPRDITTLSHGDANPPPTCRPASKYAGDPHPNEAVCKHKPGKH